VRVLTCVAALLAFWSGAFLPWAGGGGLLWISFVLSVSYICVMNRSVPHQFMWCLHIRVAVVYVKYICVVGLLSTAVYIYT
jgi:hypothetical protein